MDIWKAKHNLIPDIFFLFSDVYSWETQDGPGAKLVTFSLNVIYMTFMKMNMCAV